MKASQPHWQEHTGCNYHTEYLLSSVTQWNTLTQGSTLTHTEVQDATCTAKSMNRSACFYMHTKCPEHPTCPPTHKQENKHFLEPPEDSSLSSPSDLLSLAEEPVNVTTGTSMSWDPPHTFLRHISAPMHCQLNAERQAEVYNLLK